MKRKAAPVLDVVVEGLPEVEGGKFRVTREGVVYRRAKRGGWEHVPAYETGKNKYLTTSFFEDGVQRHYYIHRLAATAYIPNPEGKREVNHKDGNPRNNHVDNLEWATRKENCQHAYAGGLIPSKSTAGKPCAECGKATVLRTDLCPLCSARARSEAERLSERTEIALGIVDSANRRGDVLNERQIGIMRMLSEGKTYREIGESYGISRERVRQIIQRVRTGRYGKRVTKQQKDIADHLRLNGIRRTVLSEATGIEYQRLGRILHLKCGMDRAECAAILQFLGVDTGLNGEPENTIEFSRMPQGVVRRG